VIDKNAGYLKAVKTAFLWLVIPVVCSCSSMPVLTTVEPADWEAVVQKKNKIMAWEIRGRIGIQTEDEGGTLDLFWSQDEDDYTIRLIAPMGQGAFYIRGDADTVAVRTSEGLIESSQDPGLLLEQELGLDFPVMSLRQWMLGIPEDSMPVESIAWNEKGQLYRINQAGWKIEMTRYRSVGQHVFPHSLLVQRDDRPEFKIRILLRQWSLGHA